MSGEFVAVPTSEQRRRRRRRTLLRGEIRGQDRVRSLGDLVEDSMRFLEKIPRIGHQGSRSDGPSVKPLLGPSSAPEDDDDTAPLETVPGGRRERTDVVDYDFDPADWL